MKTDYSISRFLDLNSWESDNRFTTDLQPFHSRFTAATLRKTTGAGSNRIVLKTWIRFSALSYWRAKNPRFMLLLSAYLCATKLVV